MSRVVVSGIGPISSIGKSSAEFWNSLKEGKVGISFIPDELLPTKSECKVASTVQDFNIENYIQEKTLLQLLKEHPSRGIQLALASSILAVMDAKVNFQSMDKSRIGVFVGTIGNYDILYAGSIGEHIPTSKSGFLSHSGSAAALITSMFDIQGPAETLCSGCPAGMDAVGFATRMIQSGIIDSAIVVGADSEMTYLPWTGLQSANSLTTKYNDNPQKASKPFDKNRDGNVCGEGACALFLESEDLARTRKNARIYATIAGYSKMSTGTRIYNPTSPSMVSAASVKAIQNVLKTANWQPEDLSAFCANGSASVNYDKIEANAIQEVFGHLKNPVKVFSIKGMIGQHGTGCSVLQIAAACLSLYHKYQVATVNFEEPDPQLPPVNIVTIAGKDESLHKIICQAISFGGFHYSCIALEGYNQ